MKINYDLVRDILLCVETNTTFNESLYFVNIPASRLCKFTEEELKTLYSIPDCQYKLSTRYSDEELFYHIFYCASAGLITVGSNKSDVLCRIDDLTPTGHELLANIRNGTIFEKAKAIVAKVGVGSLAEFGKVAAQLTALHLKELLQHAQ